jgi:hypothetical protein
MNIVKATFKNGQIIPEGPVSWPEGTELLVEPYQPELSVHTHEEEWPTDPVSIAKRLALMDQIEPLEMTAEEEAEWQTALKAQKEFELAHWDERCRRIERIFE